MPSRESFPGRLVRIGKYWSRSQRDWHSGLRQHTKSKYQRRFEATTNASPHHHTSPAENAGSTNAHHLRCQHDAVHEFHRGAAPACCCPACAPISFFCSLQHFQGLLSNLQSAPETATTMAHPQVTGWSIHAQCSHAPQ